MSSPVESVVVEVLTAEIQRLRSQLPRNGSGAQQVLPGVPSNALLHEAAQAIVQMRSAAHSLKTRAPTIAKELEERASKLERCLPRRSP